MQDDRTHAANHGMIRKGTLVPILVLASILFGVFGSQVLGQSESMEKPIAQEELVRQELASADGDKVVTIRRVELAPGAAVQEEPVAEHPAEEFVYVLEGTASLERAGEEPLAFEPGEAWYNETELTHTLANDSDSEPLTVLVVWIGESGAF